MNPKNAVRELIKVLRTLRPLFEFLVQIAKCWKEPQMAVKRSDFLCTH